MAAGAGADSGFGAAATADFHVVRRLWMLWCGGHGLVAVGWQGVLT